MAAVVSLSEIRTRTVQWYFDGPAGKAMDVSVDPTPPTWVGALTIPITRVTGALGAEVNDQEAIDIERFYREQGLRGEDVEKMTAQDALRRVPVETIQARTLADVPVPDTLGASGPIGTNPDNDANRRLRGTFRKLTGPPRQVTDIYIPATIPP